MFCGYTTLDALNEQAGRWDRSRAGCHHDDAAMKARPLLERPPLPLPLPTCRCTHLRALRLHEAAVEHLGIALVVRRRLQAG